MKYIVFIVLIASSVKIFAQGNWTLKECIDYAKENSISVHQAIKSKEIAEQNLIASKAAFAPTISALRLSTKIKTYKL